MYSDDYEDQELDLDDPFFDEFMDEDYHAQGS